EGSFSVSEIIPHGVSEEELLEFTAAAECFSLHPVSECIRERFKVDPSVVTDASELAGKGVICKYSSKTAAAGNAQLMHHLGVSFDEVDRPGTVVYTAVDGEYIGCIVVSDTVKSTAYQAVRAIKAAGVKKTVMLSGDRENVAKSVGEKLGIDKIYASLLPEQKVQKLELEMQSSRGLTAYVGDGINDAPVIMRADVGIAMGALGSQAAIEAADVVLMDDDPSKVAKCISISRKCMSIVWQNIIFAVGIKLICLVLGALGIANMWAAIFADVGVMILAVLNAIRAMFVK
ncbi:MAG: HAD-IC family P-type ATPase, partial [Oscillospiraceae bacterium]|nr:HAD-IC family P-type ATPase [Oscillospiraceae bacterium]